MREGDFVGGSGSLWRNEAVFWWGWRGINILLKNFFFLRGRFPTLPWATLRYSTLLYDTMILQRIQVSVLATKILSISCLSASVNRTLFYLLSLFLGTASPSPYFHFILILNLFCRDVLRSSLVCSCPLPLVWQIFYHMNVCSASPPCVALSLNCHPTWNCNL